MWWWWYWIKTRCVEGNAIPAVRKLRDCGDPRAAKYLLAMILGPDRQYETLTVVDEYTLRKNADAVRSEAIEALPAFREVVLEPLTEALENEDWNVRNSAVCALAKLEALEPMTKALKNDSVGVRSYALRALAKLGATESLLDVLASDTVASRDITYVVRRLGEIGDRRAVKPLLSRFARACPYEEFHEIIAALGKLGDPCAVQALAEAPGRCPGCELEVEQALRSLGSDEATMAVARSLGEKRKEAERIANEKRELAERTIYVNNDSDGLSIKRALEHLQSNYANRKFGYEGLNSPDDDYLSEAERKLGAFRASGGVSLGSAGFMAKSSILAALKDEKLIETTGYQEFQLTDKGRKAIISVRIR